VDEAEGSLQAFVMIQWQKDRERERAKNLVSASRPQTC